MTPTRLFDFLDWQLQKFPQEDMLAAKENGVWRKYSTQEIKQLSDSLSMGLLKAGIGYNFQVQKTGSYFIAPTLLRCDFAGQRS